MFQSILNGQSMEASLYNEIQMVVNRLESIRYDDLIAQIIQSEVKERVFLRRVISLTPLLWTDEQQLIQSKSSPAQEQPSLDSILDRNQELLGIPISVLDLSVRANNGLSKAGIDNMFSLLKTSEEELRNIWSLGQKSIDEIKAKKHLFIKSFSLQVANQCPRQSESPARDQPIVYSLVDRNRRLSETPVAVLDLSVRANNGLFRAGIGNMYLLLKISENELRKIRSLGQKSVDEIVAKRELFITSYEAFYTAPPEILSKAESVSTEDEREDPVKVAQAQCLEEISAELSALDIEIISLLREPEMVRDLACHEPGLFQRLLDLMLERPEMLATPLPSHLNSIVGINKTENLDEIANNIFSSLGNREREIVYKRMGVIGECKSTLEELGQSMGVTRERIRQIESKAMKKIRNIAFHKNFYGIRFVIYRHIFSNGGFISKAELVQQLEETYTSHVINTDAFIDLITADATWFVSAEASLLALKDNEIIYPSIIETIRSYLTQENEIRSLEQIVAAVGSAFDGQLTGAPEALECAIECCIEEHPKFVMVRTGGFGLDSWPQVNPRGRRDMILSAMRKLGGPAHYSEIARFVNELFSANYSVHSIHAAIGNYPDDFVWTGIKGQYDLKERGAERVGRYIDLVQESLKQAGVPQKLNDIIAYVIKFRSVTESSILMTLSFNSDYFTCLPYGYFALKQWNLEPQSNNADADEVELIDEYLDLLMAEL